MHGASPRRSADAYGRPWPPHSSPAFRRARGAISCQPSPREATVIVAGHSLQPHGGIMRSLVLAVCVIAALASPSPAKEKDREKDALPFKPLQGAFFALSVPNLAESVQWYREKLGLSV